VAIQEYQMNCAGLQERDDLGPITCRSDAAALPF
jgi:hypothetical protein